MSEDCCGGSEEMLFPLSLEDEIPELEMDIYDPETDEVGSKKLADYKGKWLVLFFYPADFTFVCPTELKDLNKSYQAIKDANAELLVISVDTVFSHKRRVETESLLKDFGIKMVSDRKAELSDLFGILNQESGNSDRGTFIISPDGVVKSIEVVTEPIGRSASELVRKLNALDFVRNHPGEACPASWNIGLKTLKPSIKIVGNVGEVMQD